MKKAKDPRITRSSGPQLRRVLAGALVMPALLAAGCSSGPGGPGVAQVGATPSASPSSELSRRQAALAFSQCMRNHGIKDFPDPSPGGGLEISGGPQGGLDPNNPTFHSAQRACQSLLPAPSASEQHQALEQALRFSQCMRSHGIEDFPDPQADEGGGIGIEIHRGSAGADLNPNNPQFQAAQEACKHLLPGGGKEMQTQTHGHP